MKRRVRESLVVVFVLLGIALAVFSYFWFSGRAERRARQTVAVYFDDVTGLRVGDPVEVQGLPKGKVTAMELDRTRIKCRAAIDKDVGLTQDTRFAIRSVSYLGSDRYLMVTLGTGPRVGAGQAFEGHNEALDLEETFLRLDKVLKDIDPEQLADDLRQAGGDLMKEVKTELDRLGTRLDRFNAAFLMTADELAGLADGLDSLSALLEPGSTAGKLLSTSELYDDVRATNKQLQELIADVMANPKRYFKISLF
ncbi:MAG: MCE family protein [candidate division WOR-3 bacterium]|nr:MAG: MCE family protein [candidate division WOR-3 bacterium]